MQQFLKGKEPPLRYHAKLFSTHEPKSNTSSESPHSNKPMRGSHSHVSPTHWHRAPVGHQSLLACHRLWIGAFPRDLTPAAISLHSVVQSRTWWGPRRVFYAPPGTYLPQYIFINFPNVPLLKDASWDIVGRTQPGVQLTSTRTPHRNPLDIKSLRAKIRVLLHSS